MTATYTNPVYADAFPDPFVLKYCGEYWAYCTGLRADGRVFTILHSLDLVHWREVGSALEALPSDHPCYWAPEVTYDNGRFFLYYSVGNEERMQIRVATATHPAGPFVDSGQRLTQEPFAIDPHVFTNEDGRRYLFYAADFLDHSHIGTGTVMDRLLDFDTLARRPQPVTRACYDWHVYDPQRAEKGGVCWHTLEGPFVLTHKGRYYQMFSGGNWQNESYGVGYATTEKLDTAEEWAQACDGEAVRPILRTIPGKVIGPGHNSVVRGPDNRQLYCVYHRWRDVTEQEGEGRVLAIDPLDWAGERMMVLGPSVEPQPAPLRPTIALARVDAPHTISVGVPSFVAEVSVQANGASRDGRYGVRLEADGRSGLEIYLQPKQQQLFLTWEETTGWREQQVALPDDYDFHAYHLLRLEVDGHRVMFTLDDWVVRWQEVLAVAPTQLVLAAEQSEATFAGVEVTVGWEDLFMEDVTAADAGWQHDSSAAWHIRDRQLICVGEGKAWKGALLESYELVVNARLIDEGVYGFYPALAADGSGGSGALLAIERFEDGWRLHWDDAAESRHFLLPAHFDPAVYQQFRFRKEQGRLAISWDGHWLGQVVVSDAPTRVGLYGRHGAAFDLVRVTAITG